MDEIRRHLATLMESVDTSEDAASKKCFTDTDICKFYLCGLCPHDLFQNTRQYMGPCPNIHSEALRERYFQARKRHTYGYEEISLRYLKPYVDECDRRISRQTVNGRCDTQDKASESIEASTQKQIEELENQIRIKMVEAEELGNQGNVEGSIKTMDKIQELNMKKKLALVEEARSMWFQKLKPCEMCGALLSEKDGENRLNEHFLGRIHLGFEAIRKHLKELNAYITLTAPSLPKYHRRPSFSHVTTLHHNNDCREGSCYQIKNSIHDNHESMDYDFCSTEHYNSLRRSLRLRSNSGIRGHGLNINHDTTRSNYYCCSNRSRNYDMSLDNKCIKSQSHWRYNEEEKEENGNSLYHCPRGRRTRENTCHQHKNTFDCRSDDSNRIERYRSRSSSNNRNQRRHFSISQANTSDIYDITAPNLHTSTTKKHCNNKRFTFVFNEDTHKQQQLPVKNKGDKAEKENINGDENFTGEESETEEGEIHCTLPTTETSFMIS